ncbi:hypothetical protein PHYSODRAFT_286702 [Phytophthora sojae]|uniref:RxLR effector protein n=1 Tax=Phytophthora sojae (strain P6497) TaxID=1094619 RepID=G4ZRP1_PHYSP|nr:hypothetical protein PHYSODRAFT_286702 [Phytophthora sojae]EGZ13850.1 hypothetical protein PHYSODRAFT_286702 [Phytophthora sojae]|eukprot:XP_009531279.1 hypothetical protein PHYSODRAFT_286702 [Phytophthora sojae]
MQLLRQLVLLAATALVAAVPSSAAEQPAQQRTRLRGLLEQLVSDEATPAPARELLATWEDGKAGESRKLQPIADKIVGGEAVVVFNDRRVSPEAQMESAVVQFNVRTRPNCVVSVCGELTKWYLGSKEQCFDLRVAPKSADDRENGLIHGVSAAYSGLRPVAHKLYLKFDQTNLIDGDKCEYEIISGSKTVRQEELATGSQQAAA